MPRTRRAFLAAVGASATLAGCTVRAPSGDPQYRLSVQVVEGADDPFEYDAGTVRSVANRWKPMVLRSTYENTADAAETEESTMPRSPTVFSEDPEPSSIVLLAPGTGYDQRHPGCWTPDTEYVSVLLGKLDLSDLAAGSTVHLEHAVWQNPPALDDERCLQPGTYAVAMNFGLGVEIEVRIEEE
jgi:hypothetical protein